MTPVKDAQTIHRLLLVARTRLQDLQASALPDDRKELAQAAVWEGLEDELKTYVGYVRSGRV